MREIKKWFTTIISPAVERSTFVLLSSLALLLVYWKWQPMTDVVWNVENSIGATILTAVFWFGWLVVFLSTFMINHFELFGLKQIFDNLKNIKTENPKFQTNYFYKLVRHPIMLGFIIAFWATPIMTTGHLMFALVTTIYIFISVKYLEEKDLRDAIGKDYEEYQKTDEQGKEVIRNMIQINFAEFDSKHIENDKLRIFFVEMRGF